MFRRGKPAEPLTSDPLSEPSLASTSTDLSGGPLSTVSTVGVPLPTSASETTPPAAVVTHLNGPPPPVLSAFATQHQQYINSTKGRGSAATISKLNNSVVTKPVKRSHLVCLLLALPLMTATIFMGAGYYYLLPTSNRTSSSSAGYISARAVGDFGPEKQTIQKKIEKAVDKNHSSSTAQSSKSSQDKESVHYHIVFSTSCTIFQDWQSYVFFFQAINSGQTGTVTRIVSGCADKEEEEKAKAVFEREIVPLAEPGRVRIHFTPDYSHIMSGIYYPYFNKPFGMRHWLENELGFPNPASSTKDHNRDDSIVVLCDPDQIILRPFPANNDFSNTIWSDVPQNEVRTAVAHGNPMGQLYGFDLQWLRINMTQVLPHEPTPITNMTRKAAQRGYVVSMRQSVCGCRIFVTGLDRQMKSF
jgi:hypothetical protein